MIRFDGALTGNAQEYFIKKTINRIGVFGFLILLLNIPFWHFFYSGTNTVKYVVPVVLIVSAIAMYIFKLIVSKREKSKERANIRKVIIKDDVITIVSEESSTRKNIKRVKKVRDYGEFYEIIFSPLDLLTVCVCQKSLLSKGSIKDFEELFADKLIKQDIHTGNQGTVL